MGKASGMLAWRPKPGAQALRWQLLLGFDQHSEAQQHFVCTLMNLDVLCLIICLQGPTADCRLQTAPLPAGCSLALNAEPGSGPPVLSHLPQASSTSPQRLYVTINIHIRKNLNA